MDDREGFSNLTAEGVSAWPPAVTRTRSCAWSGETLNALVAICDAAASGFGGVLLWAPLTDEAMEGISQKYQMPRPDLNRNGCAGMAIETGGDTVHLASLPEYLGRVQAVSEQGTEALETHARKINWGGER